MLELYVNPDDYAASVHGQGHYACVQCHTTVGNYPHPKQTYEDTRDASLKLYPACQRCHQTQYDKAKDSVHGRALDKYVREAAICTDCHTAHTVRRLTDPKTHTLTADARVWIPTTCAKCHNAIYMKYKDSVHGAALIGQGNPDVPTCIDCHGVHNIPDPTTAAFRLNSPLICAKCHTDPKRMGKYGISTQVLNTYVADFHGTTVSLFEKQSPDAQTNKPVCYDCHGIHDIARVDDPQKGLEVKENLLKRCQVCHPDANANFPTAWLSHYIPSPEKNPLVYYVNLFYKFFIPSVLGGMAVLVMLDFSRLSLNNYRQRRGLVAAKHPSVEETQEKPVSTAETIVTKGSPAEDTPSSTATELEGSSSVEIVTPPLHETGKPDEMNDITQPSPDEDQPEADDE
jgi:nitrate/TMAO reductase-like tetraheme cytochrome c subunit